MSKMNQQSLIDMRRRLIELDKLLSLESLSRAESLLKDLQQHSQLTRELVPRRIRLAQLKGEHEEVLALCRQALAGQPANPGLWRSLTGSLLASSRPDSVRLSLDRFIQTSPNTSSATVVGVEMLQAAGWHGSAVSLIDSMRVVIGQRRFLARPRSISLLLTDRQDDAAREMAQEMRINPFNLPLLRQSVLEEAYRPADHGDFLEALIDQATGLATHPALRVFAANLLLADGRFETALELTIPLLDQQSPANVVMQNSVVLVRELPLLADWIQLQGSVDYLLGVLPRLMNSRAAGLEQNRRAAEYLARTCETALELSALGQDPREAVTVFAELLQEVRRVNPGTESLYSSQIKLAAYTRDVLGEPLTAARRMENMLVDLDLPSEGVALVRLTLGECYLAAGDTARGRVVLTRLGRDPEFRTAGGHAHYHLARLDLAEGHFSTARDRFAVVAIDHPTAPYANDSLEMGLAIAEEMENPSGGPNILSLYGLSVYYDLVGSPGDRVSALQDFIATATNLVDPEEPQHLLERGKFELGELFASLDRDSEALAIFNRVVGEHPEGRYAARSLVRRGQLLAGQDRYPDARQQLELLLAQYPDYLFVDDVRDMLRGWQ
jgi:tetratricopeptide (TPR) repeat protein